MKTIIEVDGALTAFDQFILDKGITYMMKEHNIWPVDHCGYNIDEVFNLVQHYKNEGHSKEEAQALSERTVKNFWDLYYLAYVLRPFKEGSKETIDALFEQGIDLEFSSSRKHLLENSFRGTVVRNTLKLQLFGNLHRLVKLKTFANDDDQIKYVLNQKNALFISAKPKLLQKLEEADQVDGLCINASYNEYFRLPRKVKRVDAYEDGEALDAIIEISKVKIKKKD